MPSTPPIHPSHAADGIPAAPPLPIVPLPPFHHPATADDIPITPPTSPQRHQQAARHEDRLQRQIGSPEQRRIPAGSSRLPIPAQAGAAGAVLFNGCVYNNLPADLAALARTVAAQHPQPAAPITAHASGHAPRPFPIPFPPPPPAPAVGSSSASGSALGSGSLAFSALGPAFSLAPSRSTLTTAELIAQRALLPPLQPIRRYNRAQRSGSVSVDYGIYFNNVC
jgi:hypothetical protein